MVKLDDFDAAKLNKEMSYILRSLTYIHWPKSQNEENSFWQKLKLTLMKKSSSYTNMALIE